MPNHGVEVLNEVFNLNKRPEVAMATQGTEQRTGEKIEDDQVIQNYLDRLQELLSGTDENPREQREPGNRHSALEVLTKLVSRRYLVKRENIPDSYKDKDAIVAAQKESLDTWETYLLSHEVYKFYPDWFRYWVFRSILKMGKYQKEKNDFAERDNPQKTFSPFPDLNQQALGFVLHGMTLKNNNVDDTQLLSHIQFKSDTTQEKKVQFLELLKARKPSFRKLYAWAIESIKKTPNELLPITDGKWSDPYQGLADVPKLVSSLVNQSSGWCLTNVSHAKNYLDVNKVTIFSSYDSKFHGKDETPTIPRVVVVQQPNGDIPEIRGITKDENLDPYIGNVVRDMLSHYKKTGVDMSIFEKKLEDYDTLGDIELKVKTGKELTRNELLFLYEIERRMRAFGYKRDARISELRRLRKDKIHDARMIFGTEGHPLDEDQIAQDLDEITERTKVYIGPFHPTLWKIDHIKHIYTIFPDEKVIKDTVTLGTKNRKQIVDSLRSQRVEFFGLVQRIIESPAFFPKHPLLERLNRLLRGKKETVEVVQVKMSDLGFKMDPTLAEIYARAQELGLEPCPAEAAIELLPKYSLQSQGDELYIGMPPIQVDRQPYLLTLAHRDDKVWLDGSWGRPNLRRDLDSRFAFCIRKSA